MNSAPIPIVIIGFRNASDVCGCLAALAKERREPSFAIYICENGGPQAYDDLVAALSAESGPCASGVLPLDEPGAAFARGHCLKLAGSINVSVAQARENLGYAGGINAWLKALWQSEWPGLWVLNPDTQPTPDALAELVLYAQTYDKGMVGSRVMFTDDLTVVGSRGLSWSRWVCRTIGIDKFAPVSPAPDRLDVERRMDGPHGASFYATRACVQEIGLMDESYFLYFEDLDWGIRAKAACGLGYAYQSVVPHVGGTTLGSATKRGARSELAVFLDFRNRLLFAHRHYPSWFPWTVAVVLTRSGEFLAVGAFRNFRAALSGWWAGLRGETGRPDHLMNRLFG